MTKIFNTIFLYLREPKTSTLKFLRFYFRTKKTIKIIREKIHPKMINQKIPHPTILLIPLFNHKILSRYKISKI